MFDRRVLDERVDSELGGVALEGQAGSVKDALADKVYRQEIIDAN